MIFSLGLLAGLLVGIAAGVYYQKIAESGARERQSALHKEHLFDWHAMVKESDRRAARAEARLASFVDAKLNPPDDGTTPLSTDEADAKYVEATVSDG